MTTTRKANGVLPVSSTQATNDAPKSKAKEPTRGKKVIVRRLPPGITEAEFWAILGDEWKSGNGKVDWTKFQDGHVSQDPSNPSSPARCYLQVLRTDDIPVLAEVVQRSIWEDDKKTFNDPALVGPPYLELSIYQKIPTTKRRMDSKQGTIDQDPDFMAFLDSLTQDPAVKEVEAEQIAEDSLKDNVKVTTTPLVEYLKEKKANKGKETTSAKSTKHGRHESQGGKTKGSQEDSKKKTKESKTEKAEKAAEKDEKKAKEPIKLLTKKAAAQEAAETAKPTSTSTTTTKTTEEAAPKSRRANIAAAAKILQRDLGLSPGSAHRRARQDAAKAEAAAKADSGKEKDSKDTASTTPTAPSQPTSSAPPSAPTAPKAQAAESSRRSRGAKAAKQNASGDTAKGKDNTGSTKSAPVTTPVILKRMDDTPPTGPASTTPAATTSATPTPPTGPKAAAGKASSKSGPSQKKGSGQPSITAGATRAFVKHANPSQGVTEPLLKQAMEVYGPVTFVEIDKRKGFAYVDFGDHEALVKAITASPVPVAQGTVQVLERKEIKKPAQAPTQPAADKASSDAPPDRPKRGGRGRGRRGGGNVNSANTNAPAESSSSTTPAPAADSKDSNATAPPG
ncbi:Smg-4/UPF3 family-domain-containing protein [Annulohypoxylon truncatum]|uniref:Smg-4/UPF3 family-domain-containing protein n=1 Tax=Annulohypoxylon truncatum TaxID=327061 RepID=UPI0020081D47|nr:Smg-4/UPF3 family-domain-containing protein [Annulohypoxylon truncatum]KAI1210788.1 Smg-4/UPF3 family-domain-containing protein [Annulohypoxylon truncatum]